MLGSPILSGNVTTVSFGPITVWMQFFLYSSNLACFSLSSRYFCFFSSFFFSELMPSILLIASACSSFSAFSTCILRL
uniref:Uncharacterized protein n=1 Tax=Arundo donax TaxID=35708 RepID=A0A0A9F7W9_ARUDO